MKKNMLLLLSIIAVTAFLRLFLINIIPSSVNHDQLHYLLSAKAFYATGKDFSQTVTPLDIALFHYPSNETPQAELPYFLQMITVGPLRFSQTTNAIPNALLSIGIVFLLYLISKKLFDKKTALLIALVAAINPWLVFIGRTSYDMVPFLFFFLCGFYILLIAQKWKILLSFPFFVLAFYSYIGTKIILLPLMFLTSWYCYYYIHKKKFLKYYAGLLTLGTVLIVFFFLQVHSGAQASRLSEIALPNHPAIADQVNNARKLTIHNPLTPLFDNKYTFFVKNVVSLFLDVFSPSYLFMHGDYFFSLFDHGLFYVIDALFLLIGAVALFSKRKPLFFLFAGFMLLATVPQIIHDPTAKGGNFTPHIMLLFPVFIMLIGVGIYTFLNYFFKSKRYFMLAAGAVGVVYLLLLGNFLHLYFFQFPYHRGIFDFPSRQLSQYISLSHMPVAVYTPSPDEGFKQYLFYSNTYNKQTIPVVAKNIQHNNLSLGKVTFLGCNKVPATATRNKVTIIHRDCAKHPASYHLTIADIADSGSVYSIYNDSLCRGVPLGNYVKNISLKELDVEKLSPQAFCSTYITNNQ